VGELHPHQETIGRGVEFDAKTHLPRLWVPRQELALVVNDTARAANLSISIVIFQALLKAALIGTT
jgi:hypothetical protein